MDMKKLFITGLTSVTLMASTQAYSASFESKFNADNEVTGFSYSVDGVSTVVDLSGITNLNDWHNSSSLSLNIADGASYQFVWDIVNWGTAGGGNPVAFLGEFSLNGDTYFTDNVIWEVSSAYTNGWEVATPNTTGGTEAYNQGHNTWNTNAPSDISTNSQWIWDGAASGTDDALSFRATITSPVPEPSTYALMVAGLGLVGFMAGRRKQA